jgi:GTPase SAR1 family protein
MPNIHIIATGPPASGKSQLVRHFYNNLPEGYKLKHSNAISEVFGTEYWILVIEKVRKRKSKNAKPSQSPIQ